MAALNIPDAVRACAEADPDRPFLILERPNVAPFVLTFGALITRSSRYAAEFRRRCIPKGSSVVIMLVTHPDLASVFLGSMMAGLIPAIFPPMSPKLNKVLFWASQAEAFSRIDVKLLISSTEHLADLQIYRPDLMRSVLDVNGSLSCLGTEGIADSPSEIAFIQHSSGTTGSKKGVVLRHKAVLEAVCSLSAAIELRDYDVIISWLPLYHDMGLIACLILPMVLGRTVVQIDPFDWVLRPQILLKSIESHRATLCWMPNFGFHHLMRTVPDPSCYDLSTVRAFVDCSEPCKAETMRSFVEYGAKSNLPTDTLQVCYALAENVFAVTHTQMSARPTILSADFETYANERVISSATPDRQNIEFLSCGKQVQGTEIRILDVDGVQKDDLQVGEVAICSSYLFEGYYGSSGVLPLFEGFHRTGDEGFMLMGELFVCGRLDDLLIINGRNIYAHDIEFAINKNTSVRPGRCVAFSVFNKRAGSQVLIIIAEASILTDEERNALSSEIRLVTQSVFGLTAFEVKIVEIGWLIKTTSGKISRTANSVKYTSQQILMP